MRHLCLGASVAAAAAAAAAAGVAVDDGLHLGGGGRGEQGGPLAAHVVQGQVRQHEARKKSN